MEGNIIISLFLVLSSALVAGIIAKLLKLPSLIGYILVGIIVGSVFPEQVGGVKGLAEIGVVLLLFSVGIEMSLTKLFKVGSKIILASIFQMLAVTIVLFTFLMLFSFSVNEALTLSLAFSLSSTALVVKLLEDRAETDSIQGNILISWLLTQDLAVIPIMALLPAIAANHGSVVMTAGKSLLTSGVVVVATFVLGKKVAPFLTKFMASTDSRELLLLGGVTVALGTAALVGLFGVSPALGAFLAGVVISETQENHAIFAETRPLRDIFVILFFVTLGFFATPGVIFANLFTILFIALVVLTVKFVIVYAILYLQGMRGKTNVAVSFGLTEIGEFSFVIFLTSQALGILNSDVLAIGVGVTLVTLLATPFMFKSINPAWKRFRKFKILTGRPQGKKEVFADKLSNHIIICGFGRMGSWIAKALVTTKVPFVVIDYNQKVIRKARGEGVNALYGDPTEPDVLDAANVKEAKCVVVAIPDRMGEEEIVSYCQNVSPEMSIIVRAHLDEDVVNLREMKVKRIIQPEFEAAVTATAEIFKSMGKSADDIHARLAKLRRAHSIA